MAGRGGGRRARLGLFAQVHVERSQDGKLLVTDQTRAGTQVYAGVGSAQAWRHKDGKLEVWQPPDRHGFRPRRTILRWRPAGVVFGYGPGGSGSAVYDASRQAWIPQFDRYYCGAASETLAVGFGGPGRVGIYDSASGAWQTPEHHGRTGGPLGSLVALYGSSSNTSIYDAVRRTWRTDISSFGQCTLGEALAVFYGPSRD